MSFPIVDLSLLTLRGTEEDSEKRSRDICDAFNRMGFVNIIGHVISDNLFREAFEWSRKLFTLSHEANMKVPHTSRKHFIAPGLLKYSPLGLEKVYSKDDTEADEAKESRGSSLREIQDYKVCEKPNNSA
ncbi:MAG: hypothetical protein MMC33_002445 [Icmadophila ericetorum]|nr:hypothetical protein [Icmadophila ericetorum]